jgi:hypothetical protein
MNTTSRRGAWLAGAIAAGVAIAQPLPALADYSLPPPQYDIGGETEEEVIAIAHALDINMPMIRVPFGEAATECDRVWRQRFGYPFPMAVAVAPGHSLLACLIRDPGNGNPIIVYSYDWHKADAAQLLRHEIGHWLGWNDDHRRD